MGSTRLGEAKDVYKTGRVRFGREIRLTQLGIGITLIATAFTSAEVVDLFARGWARGDWAQVAEQVAFGLIVLALVYGNLDYQTSRGAYFRRLRRHEPAPPAAHDGFFDGAAPSLTILVPSYREEPRVVEQTVLSAALQNYPNRRVVLLIDDAPRPDDVVGLRALATARALAEEIGESLTKEAARHGAACAAYLERRVAGVDAVAEWRRLGVLWSRVADWFETRAASYGTRDHVDALFVDMVLRTQAQEYRERSEAMFVCAGRPGEASAASAIDREYRRLATVFDVEVLHFERKRYANLSHERNKAANLNSYLSLMGKSFREEAAPDGERLLVETDPGDATLRVPGPDYVITLDADSLLHPRYATRLMHVIELDENRRLAVIQTPYSAIPHPALTIERVAGATTDVQYVIDQGSTLYDAAFWIGANAMLRREALEDIRETDVERGFPIHRYIQDRTVIEDTESSVDLIARGWRLYNYPERLAYSATPDDFGSLLVQRHRWANGGLLILPKLLRTLRRRGVRRGFGFEAFARIHYLVSIPIVTLGVLGLLFYPFEDNLMSYWFPLTAVPYFALYGRDLVQAGYRASDLFRVYTLNLMLLPVNLAGVLRSIHQAWTGRKSPFHRTPKVAERVSAPPVYVLLHYLVVAGLVGISAADLVYARWLHATLGLFSAACFVYALVAFIGVRESAEDLMAGRRVAIGNPPLGGSALQRASSCTSETDAS